MRQPGVPLRARIDNRGRPSLFFADPMPTSGCHSTWSVPNYAHELSAAESGRADCRQAVRRYASYPPRSQVGRTAVRLSAATRKPEPKDFIDRVSRGDIEAIELETMLLTRQPEEIFAADDRCDWDN